MKRSNVACLLAVGGMLVTSVARAGEPEPDASGAGRARAEDFSFGFGLNQFQNDFGFGLNLASPYFADGHVAVRAGGNVAFFESGVNTDGKDLSYTPYFNVKLGLVGVGGWPSESIRCYGEGGALLLLPSSDFSDTISVGGYGMFGFEFFMRRNSGWSYFLEAGAVGSGAEAEKAGDLLYSNGFALSVGWRYYL